MKDKRECITRLGIIWSIIVIINATNYQVHATNFCDFCKCFGRDKVFVIECNGVRRSNNSIASTSHEMQYFEWPTTQLDTIIANFNHLNLTVLPR